MVIGLTPSTLAPSAEARSPPSTTARAGISTASATARRLSRVVVAMTVSLSVRSVVSTLAMANSFGARSTLRVGGRGYEIFRLDALQSRVRRRPAPLHASRPARERPAARGRRDGHDGRRRGGRDVGRDRGAEPRDLLHAGARPAPGLHGRPRRRRPRGDARCDAGARRRSLSDQPAPPRRARDRPLRAGRRVRDALRLRAQRRARVRAKPRALRVPALGPDRLPKLQRRAAGDRDRPPGEPRVPRAGDRGAARSTAGSRRSPTRSSAPTRTRR